MMFDTFDRAWRHLARETMRGQLTSPRGMPVREQLGVTFGLRDPLARLVASPNRKADYGFATGEFLWYLRGARDVDSVAYYAPGIRQFSDDGVNLESAYGRRLRVDPAIDEELPTALPDAGSQWARIVRELVRDPDSRRAVMTVYGPHDLARADGAGTKDVPCTLAFQFFMRPDETWPERAPRRLHLHVTMRSCDLVWGLTNDVYSFTLLQEVMALDLRAAGVEVDLGAYLHTCGSLHAYERHWDMLSRVALETAAELAGRPVRVPAIASRAHLDRLLYIEHAARNAGEVKLVGLLGGAGWMADRLIDVRDRVDLRSQTPKTA